MQGHGFYVEEGVVKRTNQELQAAKVLDVSTLTEGESIEEAWRKQVVMGDSEIMYLFFYMEALQTKIATILESDLFVDNNYDPESNGLSPALACACYKLILMQGKWPVNFEEWFNEYVRIPRRAQVAFCYSVMETLVLERTVKKKIKNVPDMVLYVMEKNPGINVNVILPIHIGTLYEKCKVLCERAEDYQAGGWYISEDKETAMAGAIVSVIERNRMWSLLMDESDFNEWIKTNVR